MKRALLPSALILIFCVPTVRGEWGVPCETTMTLQPEYAKITTIARCSYETFGVQDNSVTIRIRHSVSPGSLLDICQAPGYCGTTLIVSPYTASTTYTSTGQITASQFGIQFNSRTVTNSLTTPAPQRPRDAPDICETQPWRCDPRYFEECPLVIQTADGPWHFTTVDEGVWFDMNGDGFREQTAWTPADSSLAFLALDLNGNGTVDGVSELFGEHSVLPDGSRPKNGFVALQQYDSNGDLSIDERDGIWNALLLWRDSNHDGQSQAAELQRVAASKIRALDTKHDELRRRDPNGNTLRLQSRLLDENGASRPYYDVYLITAR